jgi:hypothetical protein
MFNKRIFTAPLALIAMAALSACGGDSGSGSSGSGSEDITSVGTISGFGSVIVNNKHYDASNARIISADSGQLLIENPTDDQVPQYLGLGMVVAVRGSSSDDNSGVATSIRIDDELVGPVDEINHLQGFIKVNNQIVTITPATIIDDSIIEAFRDVEIANDLRYGDLTETLDDLFLVAMLVEVDGFPNDGGIEATRIEDVNNRDRLVAEDNNGEPEIKGFARNVTGTQFSINDLTVNYNSGVLDDDFGSSGLVEGQFVEVKGDRFSPTEMNATRIEIEDDYFDDDFNSGRFEIEGVVSEIRPDAQGTGGVIVIGSHEFDVDDISLFTVGQRIEIKGSIDNGSILLSGVNDQSEDNVRTEDRIVSSSGNSYTTRLGLTITATERTRLEIESGGERIEARGFPIDGNVVWTRIEVENDDDQDCRLRGPIAGVDKVNQTANDFTFTIQGVTINVSDISSDNNFEGSNGLLIGRQAFFDQLDNGDVVQATANSSGCTDGTLTAREVEFENRLVIGSGGGDDGVNDNQLIGTVSNVTDNSFDLNGRTITVNDDTLIDDSIIEALGGGEIPNDLRFGDIDETLQQLLGTTPSVEVQLNGDTALSIEDL